MIGEAVVVQQLLVRRGELHPLRVQMQLTPATPPNLLMTQATLTTLRKHFEESYIDVHVWCRLNTDAQALTPLFGQTQADTWPTTKCPDIQL